MKFEIEETTLSGVTNYAQRMKEHEKWRTVETKPPTSMASERANDSVNTHNGEVLEYKI